MQEHVELEVSLEIIMSKIAEEIFNLKDNDKLNRLMEIQERAYSGEREIIEKIIDKEI